MTQHETFTRIGVTPLDPEHETFYYLINENGRGQLVAYDIKHGNLSNLSQPDESVIEFEMTATGGIVFVSKGTTDSKSFSSESLKMINTRDHRACVLSSGFGPYSSQQDGLLMRHLVQQFSNIDPDVDLSLLEHEPTLSNGFRISSSGNHIIFSEFRPGQGKTLFDNSKRYWFGASFSAEKKPILLAETHGFSWIYPSKDFFSAALVTRAREGTLRSNTNDGSPGERVMPNSDHRIFYIGNPGDAGQFMGGFAPDWITLY